MKLTKNRPKTCCRWRSVLTTLLVAVGMLTASAQTQTLTGSVTDAADGEPLMGATIKVKETNAGVVTDLDGHYAVKVDNGQTLVVSYIGYITKSVKYTGQATLDVALSADNAALDEVVVVGYGVMKRSDITGSVVSVGEKDIKKSVITSVDQALQGRAAGVQVTQNSGSPGGGISVSIRGVNSLNGNEPLYVVDGVAIDGQTNGNSTALATINPSDIVSMEVLKDASATAIYGSRASNGVVLITTKKGQAGKPTISYEGYYAIQQIPSRLETMNLREYAVLYNERVDALGWGEREEFADPSILGDGTNWQKEIFRSAPMWNHQLSVSGGNESGQYLISGGYLSQDGIAVGSDFQRFSARVNADSKIGKWMQVGVQSYIARTEKNNTIDNGGVIETALKQLPEMPAKNPDGSWGYQETNQLATYYSNPLADALTRENYEKGLQALLNAYATMNLCKGLTLRMEYGGSYNYGNTYYFQPNLTLGSWSQTSSGSRGTSNSSYWSFKQYLTYMNTFANKHSVNIMAGHEAQESAWENLSAGRTGYLFNTVHELNVG
ncbi:MAG: SusC/RagA family TonB-linked outer membrane protein, partial [Prevotella sp.]